MVLNVFVVFVSEKRALVLAPQPRQSRGSMQLGLCGASGGSPAS